LTEVAISFRFIRSGALGLVSKGQSPQSLLTAIRKVHAGETWLGRSLTAHFLDLARSRTMQDFAPIGPPALSLRDRNLIVLVSMGWRNAEIARHLVASEAAVRASLTSIYRRLGVSGRFELVVYAVQHGFVDSSAQARPRVTPINKPAPPSIVRPGPQPKRSNSAGKRDGLKITVPSE
jgi:DNA-binding NarL/FixJ family response regulator